MESKLTLLESKVETNDALLLQLNELFEAFKLNKERRVSELRLLVDDALGKLCLKADILPE